MSEVILDTITGKSTATTITIGSTPVVSASANSMTIRGEGSAQTSIQQGLAKVWINFNGESTIASRDTFNVGSISDEGTGDYQLNYTNNMGNANYAPSGMSEADGKVVIDDSNYSSNVTTSSIDVEAKTGGTNIDREVICVTIHGDLA